MSNLRRGRRRSDVLERFQLFLMASDEHPSVSSASVDAHRRRAPRLSSVTSESKDRGGKYFNEQLGRTNGIKLRRQLNSAGELRLKIPKEARFLLD